MKLYIIILKIFNFLKLICLKKISVVLTNRVWPTDDGTNEKKINTVRPFINSALLNLGKEIRS